MGKGKYTIALESQGARHKLCKLWFGSDGSYYVTVPYHPANKAVLAKTTVNYTTSVPKTVDESAEARLDQAIDVASSDDARIKLSHHPDGFVHFSGSGVLSGKNPDGSIKGIGVNSCPLGRRISGPAFTVSIFGVNEFQVADASEENSCVFREEDMTFIPGSRGLVVEGHYFPTIWRRFVQTRDDGSKTIPIVHPAGVILDLRVLLPNDKCPIGGFFGLEVFGNIGAAEESPSGFCLSSSAGNLRKNEKGELLGDMLVCSYPRQEGTPTRRSLDYG
jgi:hypothetical protein